jgi:hypothetical protein
MLLYELLNAIKISDVCLTLSQHRSLFYPLILIHTFHHTLVSFQFQLVFTQTDTRWPLSSPPLSLVFPWRSSPSRRQRLNPAWHSMDPPMGSLTLPCSRTPSWWERPLVAVVLVRRRSPAGSDPDNWNRPAQASPPYVANIYSGVSVVSKVCCSYFLWMLQK